MGRRTIPNDPSFFALRRNNDFPLSGISPVVEGEAPAQKKTVSNGRQSFVNHYLGAAKPAKEMIQPRYSRQPYGDSASEIHYRNFSTSPYSSCHSFCERFIPDYGRHAVFLRENRIII